MENAILVGNNELDELRELAKTAGARIVGEVIQHRHRPDPATYIGKGKVQEVRELAVEEGKLQVELAQLSYRLTRLAGHSTYLSRLGGGIGTRGPGETKLEMDRRQIRHRISSLRKDIEQIRKHRQLHRDRRRKEGLPMVSLVGYTNAGKSTLFRALSKED